ncbi:unnamed protein product [Clonostachys solani]|uniref:Zn(2)-C6 fungal-type domain-containing protein n=1 Tax=Clonostachys solani TaxID=160281 RepID=A0A9N9ZMI5_9HYPO|nr:unnamed protein product [Clonostachys solani]
MPTNRSVIAKPKARSGCVTCKSRHVKCDEQKPACLRCRSSKRICGGYTVVPKSAPSATNLVDDEERRGFLYFQARTIRKIFGQQDAQDWIPLILQLGHAEAPVKHAIISLASLHRSLEPTEHLLYPCSKNPKQAIDKAQVVALKHYNAAIKILRVEQPDMTTRPDLVMILCILFVCIEQFRRNDATCLTHLLAGFRLINWWRSFTSSYDKLRHFSKPTMELVNDKITLVLQRLRVQFSLCMDSRHDLHDALDLPSFPPPTIPTCYDSLDAARMDFDRIMNYAFSVLHPRGITVSYEPAQDVISILGRWKQALDTLDSQTEGRTTLQRCIRKLLEIYSHISIIIASTYNVEFETTFDDYTPRFQAIVDLADDLVHYWQIVPQEFSLLYSFDLGLTPPMFLVASRCRHSRIRRKAMDLMLNSPFYHGAWQDRYSGLCARRMIEIEELGLEEGAFVPEKARIRKVYADLDEENEQIVMQYLCNRNN